MESAFVIHPVLPLFARTPSSGAGYNAGNGRVSASEQASSQASILRSPESALEEAVGLAAAINLNVVFNECVNISKPRPATLFGKGKLDEIKTKFNEFDHHPDLLIVDGNLTPVQHRNLEKELEIKVLDRTALILEIFGARAQTSEGRLQVDLAHLIYQRSRLVRSWTHLERQRGGAGFLGGPGERQIESDRRALADKITKLRKKLENVKRTRTLQRAKRKRAPQPVIALVGYTNAGKSTLFNNLTQSDVMAKDLLFATLDPTMRAVSLPSGQDVIMSDTVGFISDLPTQLVAAFRATLEEVLEADLIIHVRDMAHSDTDAQRLDVLSVLSELGVDTGINHVNDDKDAQKGAHNIPVIEAMNKIDLLELEEKLSLIHLSNQSREWAGASADDPVRVSISAVTGEGTDDLYALADKILTADRLLYHYRIPHREGAARAYLHNHGDVVREHPTEDYVAIDVRLTDKKRGQFESEFSFKSIGQQEEFNLAQSEAYLP